MESRPSRLLLPTLALLLIAAGLLMLLTSRSSSQDLALSSSITTGSYTIELLSPEESHYALENSRFVLQISDVNSAVQANVVAVTASEVASDASSDAVSAVVAAAATATAQSPRLLHPIIQLQMLNMDCGTVTTEAISSTPSTYSAEAAPLMRGAWLATATFQLEASNGQSGAGEVVRLYYQFEVE